MSDLNSKKRIEHLAQKWQENAISDEERHEFEAWYNSFDTIYEVNSDENYQTAKVRLYKAILEKAGISTKKAVNVWYRVAAACTVVIGVSVALYFYNSNKLPKESIAAINSKDSLNLDNKAVLILGNGSKISLTDVKSGEIANEYGVKIEKTEDGQLVYTIANEESAKENSLNTIETPYGGNYQVNLPDGSKVWLNAASKLSYPVRFSKQERVIELSGEAYFEIASVYNSNKKVPFIVKTKTQNVEVLGTQFNISAYEDDAETFTTLIEGSVKVNAVANKLNSTTLIPGQQAVVSPNQSLIGVSNVNTSSVLAWKKGYFIFDNEGIKDIMKKLARWYDIEVEYQGDVEDIEFQANYLRSRSLNNLLKTLELTNKVKFNIDGRRITVIGDKL